MTPELIAILAVGVALGGLVRAMHRDLSDRIAHVERGQEEIRGEIGDLRERMARLEGVIEGFTGRNRDAA